MPQCLRVCECVPVCVSVPCVCRYNLYIECLFACDARVRGQEGSASETLAALLKWANKGLTMFLIIIKAATAATAAKNCVTKLNESFLLPQKFVQLLPSLRAQHVL